MSQKASFCEPVTQGDCNNIAEKLRRSYNQSERRRLVEIARKRGFLLPTHFAAEMSRAREEAGEVVTFSATGDVPAPMTEERANLLATFSAGKALLAKMGLMESPPEIGGPGDRAKADRLLAFSQSGREILRRRGVSSTEIDRLACMSNEDSPTEYDREAQKARVMFAEIAKIATYHANS